MRIGLRRTNIKIRHVQQALVGKGISFQCPECESDCQLDQSFYVSDMFSGRGQYEPFTEGFTLHAGLVCENCGNLRMFNVVRLLGMEPAN